VFYEHVLVRDPKESDEDAVGNQHEADDKYFQAYLQFRMLWAGSISVIGLV
jgi:hypothetical protein